MISDSHSDSERECGSRSYSDTKEMPVSMSCALVPHATTVRGLT